MDARLSSLISPEEIAEKIRLIAFEINRQYKGKELTLIVVLKGAMCMAADLMRLIEVPFTVETVRAESYGARGTTPGELTLTGIERLEIAGRDLLIIEDIYDTGRTLDKISQALLEKNPKSLKTVVLLCRKSAPKRPDFTLFEISDEFVVGYGLDYKEHFRGLPGIFILHP